jgi:hypothetical protein
MKTQILRLDHRLTTDFYEKERELAMRMRSASAGSVGPSASGQLSATAVSTASGKSRVGTASLPARKENYKKEIYFDCIRMGEDVETAVRKHEEGTNDELPELWPAKEFLDDIRGVSENIAHLTLKIRNQEGHAEAKARAQSEAAAERRRQEEIEMRAARNKEKDIRNPKKKVALRLENTRRYGQSNERTVPMSYVEVQGETGSTERIAVVDIRGVQKKCMMMDNGSVNVEQLCEMKRQVQEAKAASSSLLSSLASTPRSASEQPYMLGECYEARREKAILKRDTQEVNRAIHKSGGAR